MQGCKSSNIALSTISITNNVVASAINTDVESDTENQVGKPSWVDKGKQGVVHLHDDVNDADIDWVAADE